MTAVTTSSIPAERVDVHRARRRLPALPAALLRRAAVGTAVLGSSLAVLLVVWALAADAFGMPFLFPGPVDVADALGEAVSDGLLLTAVGASLARIAAGFAIGSALGVTLGLVLGLSPVARGLLSPVITFFRFVPPLAWFAPVLVWFGAGESAMVVLIVYTGVFVVALSTLEGTSRIPVDMLRMAGAAGASWWQRLLWVTLPATLPSIFAGMRVAVGTSFMTVVSAEMLGAPEGLGVIVNTGMITTRIPDVFVAILALGLLGLLCDRVFVLLVNTVGRRFREHADAVVA